MGRKNIFEIVRDNSNIKNDIDRIIRLFSEDKICACNEVLYTRDMSLKDFVEEFCFSTWKSRGHCLDVDDFLSTIGYKELLFNIKNCIDSVNESLIIIEMVFNFWKLAENKSKITCVNFGFKNNFYHLFDLMQDILARLNYQAIYDKEKEQVLVIEDKPEVTAVAEIVDDDLSMEVLKYNHHTLKGDLATKKKILLRFGNELEAKRDTLNLVNKESTTNIFYMLNNFNLRHNNIDESNNKHFKKVVAEMKDGELEEWYDELYQMILLAFLELDNKDRTIKFKEIKDKIENGEK